MTDHVPTRPDSQQAPPSGSPLQRIPLTLRMLFYGVFFLGAVLVGLPWAFYQIDVYFPAVHVEIGSFRIVGVILTVICFSLCLKPL